MVRESKYVEYRRNLTVSSSCPPCSQAALESQLEEARQEAEESAEQVCCLRGFDSSLFSIRPSCVSQLEEEKESAAGRAKQDNAIITAFKVFC